MIPRDSREATVAEFQALYEREYGKPISPEEARELVRRLLTLYALLARPPRRKAGAADSHAASNNVATSQPQPE